MTAFATKILICISQLLNVCIGGGDTDEMLSSWAWRMQCCSGWAAWWCWFLDNYAWPLSQWRTTGMTHCEWCFHSERERLTQRVKEFER